MTSNSWLHINAAIASNRPLRLLAALFLAAIVTGVFLSLLNFGLQTFFWARLLNPASDTIGEYEVVVEEPGKKITIESTDKEKPARFTVQKRSNKIFVVEESLGKGEDQDIALISNECVLLTLLCPVSAKNSVSGILKVMASRDKSQVPQDKKNRNFLETAIQGSLTVDGVYVENMPSYRLAQVLNGTDLWGCIQFGMMSFMMLGVIKILALRSLRVSCDAAKTVDATNIFLRIVTREGLPGLSAGVRVNSGNESIRVAAENEMDRLMNWFWLPRYLVWLLPSIGFFGTVIGMSEGLLLIDEVSLGDDVRKSAALFSLGGSLGTAFYTTLVGLIASIILKFTMDREMSECISTLQEAAEDQGRESRVSVRDEPEMLFQGLRYTLEATKLPWLRVMLCGATLGLGIALATWYALGMPRLVW